MYSTLKNIKIGTKPSISIDYMGQGDMIVFLHGIGGNKKIGKITYLISQKNSYQLHGTLVDMVKVKTIQEILFLKMY